MAAYGAASKKAKDKNNELWDEDYRQEPKRDSMASVTVNGPSPLNLNRTRPGNQDVRKYSVGMSLKLTPEYLAHVPNRQSGAWKPLETEKD
jgi:hypothetical protein